MLEKLPSGVGHMLERLRPGPEKLLISDPRFAGAAAITVTSPAFAAGEPIPKHYTADGAKLSPPLAWSGVPAKAARLVLVIEDADSPTLHPLVHAIVADLAAEDGALPEGALPGPGGDVPGRSMGRNSYFRRQYLPPDPPPGHGPHRYAFELFALDTPTDLGSAPGRSRLAVALRGHVIAMGCLIGTYVRS